MDLPILCTLTEEQMRERRSEILELFRARVCGSEALPNGYAFQLSADALVDIARLVDLERQCCKFLSFRIVVEPEQQLRLEITGPPQAKSIIADFFSLTAPSLGIVTESS